MTAQQLVGLIFQLLYLLILAKVILSWILDPFHEIRRFVDSLVEPMLAPIRRLMPATGGLDLSPMVLIFVLYLVRILISGFL